MLCFLPYYHRKTNRREQASLGRKTYSKSRFKESKPWNQKKLQAPLVALINHRRIHRPPQAGKSALKMVKKVQS
jgi:hypothetical protein